MSRSRDTADQINRVDSSAANATAITIDSSENVLVGKTSTGISAAGHSYKADGTWEVRRDLGTANSSSVGYLSRGTTDGSILTFYKDTTAVGSWRSRSGDRSTIILDPRSGGGGLSGGGAGLYPTDNAGTISDGALTLGDPAARFKDIYLSGGVFLGGTGASNKLDDYEEGEFDVSLTPNAGGSITMQNNKTKAKYTKIGNLVTVSGQIRTASVSNMSGDHIYMSLPYAIASGSDLSSHGWSHVVIYGSSYTNRDMGLWTFAGSSTARFLDSTYVNIPQNVFNGGEEIIFTLSYKTA